ITCAKDAIEFAIVGSDAIGLGTGLFYEPLMCKKLLGEMREYLASHQMDSYSELVGTLVTPG
ncbi:MAG: dihydroorotate dehydrogenase, partial [Mariprofundus sp.]|nr:dihydroorotate dehydrogenase [Mariprofundus sp.]